MKNMAFVVFLILVSCKEPLDIAKNEIIKGEQGIVTVDFQGLEAYLDNHNSGTLVVNFWATWCKPCIKELPAFEKLNANYTNQNVSVILVSLDFPDQQAKLKSYIKKKNLQSEIIFLDDGDSNDWIPKVDKNWSGAIPATFIMTGKNRKFYERSFTYEELEGEVRSHINL